jgi:integrase
MWSATVLWRLAMQNLLHRGHAWFARYIVPKDRWGDVGRAMKAPNGTKREIVRTLSTTDLREAKRRLQPALAAIQADVEGALRAAGLRPLTAWKADWQDRARELRAILQAPEATEVLSIDFYAQPDGTDVEQQTTHADYVRAQVAAEAEQLEQAQGFTVAQAFFTAATTEAFTIRDGVNAWLIEAGHRIKPKTIGGHRLVFDHLEAFLRSQRVGLSLDAMTFADVTRRLAGQFVEHRLAEVSPAAVQREVSSPMGLWRWALRKGHADLNPWADQAAGLGDRRRDPSEVVKRPFTTRELVALLRAAGDDWAPNGGGYGATLWDAVRLALLTGLRAAELADLRVCDLIEGGRVIVVPKGKTRNAARRVPLPTVAQQVLAERLAGLPETSAEAPLWPEIPITKLTGSRGGKLSDRFRVARERLLPAAIGVDFHSLRRSYATALEAAMNRQGRVNAALIASLMGHARGTMALDLYSGGAGLDALRNAVADLEQQGFDPHVIKALDRSMNQRPTMVRFAPVRSQRDTAE